VDADTGPDDHTVPTGPDPADVPDPMPDDLQRDRDDEERDVDATEGGAPTG
jgi:hypothetical protein